LQHLHHTFLGDKKGDIEALEKVQKKATKIIPVLKKVIEQKITNLSNTDPAF